MAFFLIDYTHRNQMYYLRLSELLIYWERANSGGRKSFRYDELDERFFLPSKKGIMVPYLDMINLKLLMIVLIEKLLYFSF